MLRPWNMVPLVCSTTTEVQADAETCGAPPNSGGHGAVVFIISHVTPICSASYNRFISTT